MLDAAAAGGRRLCPVIDERGRRAAADLGAPLSVVATIFLRGLLFFPVEATGSAMRSIFTSWFARSRNMRGFSHNIRSWYVLFFPSFHTTDECTCAGI